MKLSLNILNNEIFLETHESDSKVLLRLDWSTQLQKIKNVPANFEKTPELTVALSAGGAVIGKTLGSAVASKAAAGTAGSKILGGKLASPFAAKVCKELLRLAVHCKYFGCKNCNY